MTQQDLTLDVLHSPQPLGERATNRSRSPKSSTFAEFMGSNWAQPARSTDSDAAAKVAGFLPARHAAVTRHYPGTVLVIPAGSYKTRSADEDYLFRPHSAFVWATGLGGEFEPDSAVVFYPHAQGHEAVLYFQPPASRSTDQFYADSRYGEFWVGARPTIAQMEAWTGLTVRPLTSLEADLRGIEDSTSVRVVRGEDATIDELIAQVVGAERWASTADEDKTFEVLLGTVRMWKDQWEVEQIRQAVNLTAECFESVIASIPQAVGHPRGERVAEVAFSSTARLGGHGTGFDTIAAAGAHSTTLHYMENSGPVAEGDLLLIDAGAELDSLYTGDITRTFPVSGTFSPSQRKVYEAVLGANEAAFRQAQQPGCKYGEVHDAAIRFLAETLAEWGVLPCSVEEAVSPEGQQVRRWMPHGTGHHLGVDTHDCSVTPREFYVNSPLEPGMVFTIEPGLYFRVDDELVPPELRGIGIRIEDDIVVDPDGSVRRLSAAIPRSADEVEAWMREVWAR